ncbi:MAG TPA: vitamin K epoxide reductase family protein [Chthonomonadaceae bacterium]|nr:vitamin K epoxide reductase family protein [Chthonomonadaceae bacterium]
MNTRSLSNYVTLGLAGAGVIVASLLTYEHFRPDFSLPCGAVGGGCKGALGSTYGHIGPIPTATFGLLMYLALVALCLVRRNRLQALREAEAARAAAYATAGIAPEAPAAADAEAELPPTPGRSDSTMRGTDGKVGEPLAERAALNRLDGAIWWLSLAGVAISWWLQYVAFFVLFSFCPYCFSSAILITLIFLLASRDYWLDGRQLTGEQKMLAGVCAFIAILFAFMAMPQIADQWGKVQKNMREGAVRMPTTLRELIAPAGMHLRGDPKSPILVVEFADYQCPSCKNVHDHIDDFLSMYKGKVRLAFRNLPLPMHEYSTQLAVAAEAAEGQGKFWQMHDYIYDHQTQTEMPDFSPKEFLKGASVAGIDVKRLEADMQNPKYMQRVNQDRMAATAGGASMTPTFFIISPSNKITRVAGMDNLRQKLDDKSSEAWK